MKPRLIDRGHRLHVIAGAVLVALGSAHATAQQAGQEEADRPQTQQQSPLSQRESQDSVSQSQDSASQRAGQASEQESETPSAAADTESAGGSGQLDQIAQEHEDLSTFIEAVKAAGMEESLTGGTEYTVFAPTNDAWEQMSGQSMEELMRPENREQLVSLLRAHIVADDVDENLARTLQEAQTIDGGTVELSASGDELQVGDATIVDTGIQEGSLRVYAIDQVLEPTAVARAEPGSESESESESGSELDIGSEREGSELDIGSERDGGSPLDTESQREPGSLDTPSDREPGSTLERDDPFGSDRPDAGQSPGADRPGASPSERPEDPLGSDRN